MDFKRFLFPALTFFTKPTNGNSGLLPAHYEIRVMLGHDGSADMKEHKER
jgi:hypothetical protein